MLDVGIGATGQNQDQRHVPLGIVLKLANESLILGLMIEIVLEFDSDGLFDNNVRFQSIVRVLSSNSEAG